MARGMSLHIGVNECNPEHYRGWSGPLNACENDADEMYALAGKQGFEATVLKTAAATRDAVTDHIREVAGSLVDGDMFFLTYAGHGGRITDVDGDEEDGKDETWCLYDGQLLDDELNILWSEFDAGVRILMLSDSCHSGSVSKAAVPGSAEDTEPAPGEVQRFMPRNAAVQTYKKNREFYANLQLSLPNPRPKIAATVRLISGCQDDQRSAEQDGNGLFTRALAEVWSGGSFDGSYAALHEAVCARLPKKQQPNHLVIGAPSEIYDREKPFTI